MQTTMTTHDRGDGKLESEHVLQTYRRAPVVFERGSGCRLFDASGRGYLDFISGIGVSSLGHAHPRLAAAIAAQARPAAPHLEPVSSIRCRVRSRRSSPRCRDCRACSSATAARKPSRRRLKFARRYWFSQGTPRTAVVALQRAFHGRTMGALSVTWDEHYRAPFSPLLDGVTFVSNDDPAELPAAVTDDDRGDHRRAAAR